MNNPGAPRVRRRAFPAWLPAAALLVFTAVWFGVRAVHGIHFLTFVDESGHLVGARAIAAGDRLYRDFIDAHGPLSFMVAQGYGVLFGWTEPLEARWATVVFILAAAASIAASPALRGPVHRLLAASIFLGLSAAPWLMQSMYMVNYHVPGGALIAVALAWLVVPAWADVPVAGWQASVSGFCLALTCAAAYSLAPSALLLMASAGLAVGGVRRKSLRRLMVLTAAGFLAGVALVFAWLLIYGDLLGYFVFHFIQQQVNYARYIPFGWRPMLASLLPSLQPARIVQSTASIEFFAALILIAAAGGSWRGVPGVRRSLALAAWIIGILMVNFRGASGFQDGTFLVASAAMLALLLPLALARTSSQSGSLQAVAASIAIALLLAGVEMMDRQAISSPFLIARPAMTLQPAYSLKVDQGAIGTRLRQVLRPDERLLVLVYEPSVYLTAGFLPMRRFHEYLPWEADYARAPWFGIKRDLCATLTSAPPPAIVYQPWKVWDRYDPDSFMPCLKPLLAKDYAVDTWPTLYIRKDRLPASAALHHDVP